FFSCSVSYPDLHSFPTRRSSDLKWNYVSDPTVSARTAGSTTDFLGRVTAQVTPRNKVNFSYDQQFACSGSSYDDTSRSCRPRGSDRKSTRLNSSHDQISYAVFRL